MTADRQRRQMWICALALTCVAASASQAEARRSPGLTYGMIEAIVQDIRTGPLGQSGVFFGEVRTAADARVVLRTLGLDVEDLWWVPDVDGDGTIDLSDAAAMMRLIGGYAEGATSDRVARAFVTSGLIVGGSTSTPAEPTYTPDAHHTYYSSGWTDHASSLSSTWPPNHLKAVSLGWTHQFVVSQTWPPNHAFFYSQDWPQAHGQSWSRSVPPGHAITTSRDWLYGHQQAVSRIWPPGHAKAISLEWPSGHTTPQSQQSNPSPHLTLYSSSWGGYHATYNSHQIYPPNHNWTTSQGWNGGHDLSKSKVDWPPMHMNSISLSWQPGQSWPPNHHASVSTTWPTPGTTTGPTPTQPIGSGS